MKRIKAIMQMNWIDLLMAIAIGISLYQNPDLWLLHIFGFYVVLSIGTLYCRLIDFLEMILPMMKKGINK